MSTTRQEGIGLYRGDGSMAPGTDVIRDDLRPGQAPHPSEGFQGPPMSVPVEDWQKHIEAIERLGQQINLMTRPDIVVGVAQGNTDSSGNLKMSVYRVAAGMEARLGRLTGTALVAATGVAYTAAVPYTNAAAYLELHDTDSSSQIGPTSLMDFGPPTAGGPVFPFLFTDQSMQAALVRGPREFVLNIVSGPASTMVVVRYQIHLSRMKGVA